MACSGSVLDGDDSVGWHDLCNGHCIGPVANGERRSFVEVFCKAAERRAGCRSEPCAEFLAESQQAVAQIETFFRAPSKPVPFK
jgi:hypothetical protein